MYSRDGFDSAVNELKKLNARRVFVQYPEGLKLGIQEISDELESSGFDVVVCNEACFGACDIRDSEAERIGCDSILHIGHADYGVASRLPVVYWEYFIETNPIPALENGIGKLDGFEKIGIVSSLQYVGALETVKKYLEEKGKRVFIHKSMKYAGQILGCNLAAAVDIDEEVECFLCVSAGKFYGLGLTLEMDKPVFCLDIEINEISDLNDIKKKIQKTIAWNKSKLEDAKKVGILVSWKHGQLKDPFEVKKKLEEGGKEAFIFAMDEITPEKLVGLKIDFVINLACPRIGVDDLERYKVPMLNLKDVEF